MAAEPSQTNVNGQGSSENDTDLERDILAQQIAVSTLDIAYFQLFRYATNQDLLIIAISFLCAIIAGALTTAPALLTALLVGSIQES